MSPLWYWSWLGDWNPGLPWYRRAWGALVLWYYGRRWFQHPEGYAEENR